MKGRVSEEEKNLKTVEIGGSRCSDNWEEPRSVVGGGLFCLRLRRRRGPGKKNGT